MGAGEGEGGGGQARAGEPGDNPHLTDCRAVARQVPTFFSPLTSTDF